MPTSSQTLHAVPSEGTAPQPEPDTAPKPRPRPHQTGERPLRVWVTGASGFLGTQLLSEFEARHWRLHCLPGSRPIPPGSHELLPIGINDTDELIAAARRLRPHAIVHAAAVTKTGWCEQHPAETHRINVASTRALMEAAEAAEAHFIFTSTDLVFRGDGAPYVEADTPHALMAYGRSKVEAEELLNCSHQPTTICRLALMFGPATKHHQSCLSWMLEGLLGEHGLRLFEDEFRTPADVRTVARAIAEVVERRALGVFHLGGAERVSRVEFGEKVARAWGLSTDPIEAARLSDSDLAAARPADVSLDSTRARDELDYEPAPLDEALSDYAAMYPDGAI